jgi:hypothetical protein
MRRRKFLIGSGATLAASGLSGLPPVVPTRMAKGAGGVWTLEVFDFAATWTEPVGIVTSQGVSKIHVAFPIDGTFEAAKEIAREYFMSVIEQHRPGDAVQLLDQKGEIRFIWIRHNATAEVERRQLGASPGQR